MKLVNASVGPRRNVTRVIDRLPLAGIVLAAALAVLAAATRPAKAADDVLPQGYDKPRDVPHGQVATEEYDSKTLGFKRKLTVYTPPGFNRQDAGKKYPVLYLLHGAG